MAKPPDDAYFYESLCICPNYLIAAQERSLITLKQCEQKLRILKLFFAMVPIQCPDPRLISTIERVGCTEFHGPCWQGTTPTRSLPTLHLVTLKWRG
jgi:hypothetical protein